MGDRQENVYIDYKIIVQIAIKNKKDKSASQNWAKFQYPKKLKRIFDSNNIIIIECNLQYNIRDDKFK